MSMVYFLDTNVPMYAAGGPHPYREPCLHILRACAVGTITCVTDTEVVQEILHRYSHIGRRDDGLSLAEDFVAIVPFVLPITLSVMAACISVMRSYVALPSRDAVHLAVAQEAGVSRIVSADRHFDLVAGPDRVDPAELARELED